MHFLTLAVIMATPTAYRLGCQLPSWLHRSDSRVRDSSHPSNLMRKRQLTSPLSSIEHLSAGSVFALEWLPCSTYCKHELRSGSKGELCGLLLFVHNGRECLGDRQDKAICYIRLEGFETQSDLRNSVEALCLSCTCPALALYSKYWSM